MFYKELIRPFRCGFLLLLFFYNFNCFAQQISSKSLEDSISIINDSKLSYSEKLQKFYHFKNSFEKNKNYVDSTYAFLLHKIGLYEYIINKNYEKAINLTLLSIQINTSGAKNCSFISSFNSFSNLAYYYKATNLFTKSLQYCDSVTIYAGRLKNISSVINILFDAKLTKANVFFHRGDYQKCLEECNIEISQAIKSKDSLHYLFFINQRSQAFFIQNQLVQSYEDVNVAINLANTLNKSYELASAYKMQGKIYTLKKNYLGAKSSFNKAITQRLKTEDYGQVAEDYNDFGNFYADSVKDIKQAKSCYLKGIEYAQKDKDSLRIARLNGNIGNTFFQEKNFLQAQTFYEKAFNYLKLNSSNFFSNPTYVKTDLIGDKELLIYLFKSKTELLLNQYFQNHNQAYLNACINTALTTDSVIAETRHEQLGEQSKLYWRDNTRDFYINAINACYFANDAKMAFYFMEKSRAVLLNDKLNELGASAHLPATEAEKEDSLRSNIIQLEQQLVDLKEGTKIYEALQMKFLGAKENWEKYTQSLEQKYPAYYQYKYNDQVPDLQALQQYLTANNQAFIHYFITDSLIYILGITPNNTKLIKVSKNAFDIKQLSAFLKMCSDNQALNSRHDAFKTLSNSIYTALFQPLQIQQKRVVVCADNFLIPFGALCTDKTGEHFLIKDHAFSYAYSARSLLKPFNNPSSCKGDFLGVAPVSFAPYLQLPDLKQSADAVSTCSSVFNSAKLLLNKDATRYSFIKLLPYYSVVNVFSHASADSSGEEPLLYMVDSVIHLSELQIIKSPATQLVVLSACQTNVGKLATGEGIYSLARGFASSGIPSVAATLWKADEDAIYEITQLFEKKLAEGMPKDEALQEAEIEFMKNGNEKKLPYYWANMVLVGNAEPVKLSSPHHWVLIVSIAGIVSLLAILIMTRKRKTKEKYN